MSNQLTTTAQQTLASSHADASNASQPEQENNRYLELMGGKWRFRPGARTRHWHLQTTRLIRDRRSGAIVKCCAWSSGSGETVIADWQPPSLGYRPSMSANWRSASLMSSTPSSAWVAQRQAGRLRLPHSMVDGAAHRLRQRSRGRAASGHADLSHARLVHRDQSG